MKKRLFTLLLAVMMLATCLPFTAMAAEKIDGSILYYDDFESDTIAGKLDTNVSASVTEEQFYAGAKSMKITGYTRAYDMGPEYSLKNKVKQGHTYEISFWAKVPEDSEPMVIHLKMSYNRNGTTSYPTIVSDTEINSEDWTLFKGSYTLTFPEDEINSMNLYIETPSEYLGSPYFVDEFLVRDTLAAEPEQPEDNREFVAVPPNLQGTSRGEAIEFLKALEICDFSGKEEFSFENTMKRIDFATILEKFYAEDAIVKNFKSVDAGKAVTYNDVARGLMNVLGYDLIVKNSNSRNYYAMASQIGLLKGLSVKATDSATVADILLILYNMSEISPLRPEVVGNPTKYGVDKDTTLYTEYYNMYKREGVVTGTYYSMLLDESTISIDKVEIDGELFYIGNTKADDLLGLSVTYYYVVDPKDGSKTLVCIAPYRNEIMTINSDDIISYSNGEYIYYDENNKEEKIKISMTASTIYNGQFKAILTDDELCPVDGSITFVDSNRDDVYETVKIDDVKYVTVDRVDIYKVAFYGKNKEVIEFDPYDSDTIFDIRNAEGKVAKLSTIVSGDLLAIRESKGENRHLVSVKVIKDSVEGVVSAMTIADKNSSYIKIDEQIYSLTSGLINAIQSGVVEKPGIGTVARALLVENGKVASIKLVSVNDIQYGYVIYAEMGTKAFDKNLMIKVLKPDGEIGIFKTADKVVLDGSRVAGDGVAIQNAFCPGGVAKNQMIGYRTNEEEKIVMLDTTFTDTDNETSVSIKEVYNTGTSTKNYYTRAGCIFGTNSPENYLSEDAVVYMVPTTDFYDEFLYEVGTTSLLSSGSSYRVVGYSIRNIDFVSDLLVVCRDSDLSLSNAATSLVMLVNEISEVVNEKGEIRTKITGLVKNSKTSILVEDRTSTKVVASVKPGDMIRYRTSINGEVIVKEALKNFARIAQVKEVTVNGEKTKRPELLKTSTTYSGQYWGVGTVLEFKEGYLKVKLSTNDILYLDAGRFNISKYDKVKGVYESGIQGAIVDAVTNPDHPSTVFVRMRQRYAEELIIFE